MVNNLFKITDFKGKSIYNPKVDSLSISLYYDDCVAMKRGWYCMIQPQYVDSDGNYKCNDVEGFCFLLVQDDNKSDYCRDNALNNIIESAKFMINEYMTEIILL